MPYTPEEIKNHHSVNFELPIELIKFIDEKMLIAGLDGYGATSISIDKKLWYSLGRDQVLELFKDKTPQKLNLAERVENLIVDKIKALYVKHGWKSVSFNWSASDLQIVFDSKESNIHWPNGRGGW